MKNKLLKISFSLLLILTTLFIIVVPSFAWDDPAAIKATDKSGVAKTAQNIAGEILAVVQVIGAAVAVIMLIILAIKYISAAPNDKAEIKKHAVVYIVGAVVLFAASGILGIIRGFAEQINEAGEQTHGSIVTKA